MNNRQKFHDRLVSEGMVNNEYLIRVKLHKKAGNDIIKSILDEIERDDCVIEAHILPEKN